MPHVVLIWFQALQVVLFYHFLESLYFCVCNSQVQKHDYSSHLPKVHWRVISCPTWKRTLIFPSSLGGAMFVPSMVWHCSLNSISLSHSFPNSWWRSKTHLSVTGCRTHYLIEVIKQQWSFSWYWWYICKVSKVHHLSKSKKADLLSQTLSTLPSPCGIWKLEDV